MKAAAAKGRPYDAGPIAGKGTSAGITFEPAAPQAAVPGMPEPKLPRPTRSRLPIDGPAYDLLKATAPGAPRIKGRHAHVHEESPERELLAVLRMPASPVASESVVAGFQAFAGGPAMAAPSGPPPTAPAAPPAATTVIASFAGIPHTGWFPYDCAMATGPRHVLLAVNSSIAILPRAGGAALLSRSLGAWFATVVHGVTVFDPRAAYDHYAGRWILVAGAYDAAFNSWLLVSVSRTDDPTGAWFNYALDSDTAAPAPVKTWADYPALGFDDRAIHLTANMFGVGPGSGFVHSMLRVIDKATLYAGAAAKYKDFIGLRNADGSLAFTVQPCLQYDAGPSQYLVNSLFPDAQAPAKSEITLWKLAGGHAKPVLTRSTVATDPYAIPPHAPQPAGAPPLDTGDIRLQSAACRAGSVWTGMTTRQTWADGSNTAAIYWMQVDAATAARVQHAVFGAEGKAYFYPALVTTASGTALCFSRVSPTEAAAFYVTSRRPADAPGTVAASVLLHGGSAGYTCLDSSGRNRWGDYHGISADPSDPDAAWVFGGYAAGAATWASWVAGIRP